MLSRKLSVLAAVAGLSCALGQALGQGIVVADGGGHGQRSEFYTVEIFERMVKDARKGLRLTGPDLRAVVLGAIPLDEDERPAHFIKAKADAADGLVIPEGAGNDASLFGLIDRAGAVWVRGGDQGRYVGWWRGTETERALKDVWKRGGVVGGTSAGCAIMGEVTYAALKNSLHPRDILTDAAHENLTLVDGFLNLVPGVLFDTHFIERGRIARLPVMLAATKAQFGKEVAGVGVDPRTAVVVGPDGVGEVVGEGLVTWMRLTEKSECVLTPGAPPVVTNVVFATFAEGTKFELTTGRVVHRLDGVVPRKTADAGAGSAYPAMVIRGESEQDAASGTIRVLDKPFSQGTSRFERREGAAGIVPGLAVATRIWHSRNIEELTGGMLEALAHPGLTDGLMIGRGAQAVVDGPRLRIEADLSAPAVVAADGESREGELAVKAASAVLVTNRGVTHAGVLPPVERFRNAPPRAALEGAMLHVLAPGWGFDLATGQPLPPAQAK